MILHDSRWYCTHSFVRQAYELFLCVIKDDIEYFANDVSFVKEGPSSCFEPLLLLPEDQAQNLIDALWSAGLRPTEGHGSVGQLGATERHLADMSKIVFKSLGIERQK